MDPNWLIGTFGTPGTIWYLHLQILTKYHEKSPPKIVHIQVTQCLKIAREKISFYNIFFLFGKT